MNRVQTEKDQEDFPVSEVKTEKGKKEKCKWPWSERSWETQKTVVASQGVNGVRSP